MSVNKRKITKEIVDVCNYGFYIYMQIGVTIWELEKQEQQNCLLVLNPVSIKYIYIGTICYADVLSKRNLNTSSKNFIFVDYNKEWPSWFCIFPKEDHIKKVMCMKFNDNFENVNVASKLTSLPPLPDDNYKMIAKDLIVVGYFRVQIKTYIHGWKATIACIKSASHLILC